LESPQKRFLCYILSQVFVTQQMQSHPVDAVTVSLNQFVKRPFVTFQTAPHERSIVHPFSPSE
jgi:hypothetical protein